jgi:hypothetical protein
MMPGQQVGHAALAAPNAPLSQHPVNLRDTAVLLMPQRPHQRAHVQPKLVLRHGNPALLFQPVRPVVTGAGRIAAAAGV